MNGSILSNIEVNISSQTAKLPQASVAFHVKIKVFSQPIVVTLTPIFKRVGIPQLSCTKIPPEEATGVVLQGNATGPGH